MSRAGETHLGRADCVKCVKQAKRTILYSTDGLYLSAQGETVHQNDTCLRRRFSAERRRPHRMRPSRHDDGSSPTDSTHVDAIRASTARHCLRFSRAVKQLFRRPYFVE